MKVLIVSSRFPWPSYTGDRIRVSIWLDALRDRAEVVLIAPPGDLPAKDRNVHLVPAHRSAFRFLEAAATSAFRGLPYHALITAGYDWPATIQRAVESRGPFEHAIVLLSRLHPWTRQYVKAQHVVLDAIDSLAVSTAERARAARGPARRFWSMESRRTERLEREIGREYEKVLVVSEMDARFFGTNVEVISNGITIEPLGEQPRTIDCAFWGRLGYFANHRAARTLLDEVWPRVRAERPNATLLIAGADAPPSIRKAHGRHGVEVRSPVDDLRSLVRRVRIALFPVQFGTGQATKVLEAAEAGCALVATPEAVRGLAPIASEAKIARDPEELARVTVGLLGDPEGIRSMGTRLRTAVQHHYSREQTIERLSRLMFTP